MHPHLGEPSAHWVFSASTIIGCKLFSFFQWNSFPLLFHIELMEMYTFSHCRETTVEAYKPAKTCVLKTCSVKVIDVQFCLFIDNIHEIQAHLRTVANFIWFEELIEELNFFSCPDFRESREDDNRM